MAAETVCKNIGHGVTEVLPVPSEQVQQYVDNGYIQCDLGDPSLVGYCTMNPEGTNCSPIPVSTPVVAPVATPIAQTATAAPVAFQPTRLPEVGPSATAFLIILAISGLAAFVTNWVSSKRT